MILQIAVSKQTIICIGVRDKIQNISVSTIYRYIYIDIVLKSDTSVRNNRLRTMFGLKISPRQKIWKFHEMTYALSGNCSKSSTSMNFISSIKNTYLISAMLPFYILCLHIHVDIYKRIIINENKICRAKKRLNVSATF